MSSSENEYIIEVSLNSGELLGQMLNCYCMLLFEEKFFTGVKCQTCVYTQYSK